MARNGLTPQQLRFVEEYLIDLNATEAAKRAGYSERNCNKIGPKLVGKSRIKEAIDAAIEARAKRVCVNADQVVNELANVAFCDPADILDFTGDQPALKAPKDIPEKARRAISSIKVKRQLEKTPEGFEPVEIIEFRFWPKVEALGKLGQHLKMFTDKVEITGDSRMQIVEEIVDVDADSQTAPDTGEVPQE